MKVDEIALELTKREGKSKQMSIAQVKELLGQISELIFENPAAHMALVKYGRRRVQARKGK